MTILRPKQLIHFNRPLAPVILFLTQFLGFNMVFGLAFKYRVPISGSLFLTTFAFGLVVWFLVWNLAFLDLQTLAQRKQLQLRFKEYWIWINYVMLIGGILIWYFTSDVHPMYL